MEDKALNILLMVLFGMGGITILVLVCIRPMPLTERILTTSAGFAGLFWVSIRALMLRLTPAKKQVKSKEETK